jgi:hypothetical protein
MLCYVITHIDGCIDLGSSKQKIRQNAMCMKVPADKVCKVPPCSLPVSQKKLKKGSDDMYEENKSSSDSNGQGKSKKVTEDSDAQVVNSVCCEHDIQICSDFPSVEALFQDLLLKYTET